MDAAGVRSGEGCIGDRGEKQETVGALGGKSLLEIHCVRRWGRCSGERRSRGVSREGPHGWHGTGEGTVEGCGVHPWCRQGVGCKDEEGCNEWREDVGI